MFRPQLVRPADGQLSRGAATAAGALIGAEFLALTCAAGLLWATAFPADGGRPSGDDVLSALPVTLAPLMVYDCVVLVVGLRVLMQHWAWLLRSERCLRMLHLHGIAGRLSCALATSLWAPHANMLLPFYLTFAGQLLLNATSVRSVGLLARALLVDLSACLIATQALCRARAVITWSWTAVIWPLWVFVVVATTIGMGAALVSSRPHRMFWVFSTSIAALFGLGLADAAKYMDGEDIAPHVFFVPLLLSLGLVFLGAVCAGVGFAASESLCAHSGDEGSSADTGQDARPELRFEGLPLPTDGTLLRLQAVSSTYFRTLPVPAPGDPAEGFQGSGRAPEAGARADSGGSPPGAAAEDEGFARPEPDPAARGSRRTGGRALEVCLPLCCICADREADAVVMDCGHGGLCHICAPLLFKRTGGCCICRSRARGVVRLLVEPGRQLQPGEVVEAMTLATW